MKENEKDLAAEAMEERETTAVRDESKVIRFNKPFDFEHNPVEEIDLSGLDEMTVGDVAEIQGEAIRKNESRTASLAPEVSTAFAMKMAAKASGRPIELFQQMPAYAMKKVRRAVQTAMNHESDADDKKCVLRFAKPYLYKGETYTEVNLAGMANLTSMHLCEAEEQMIEEGVIVGESASNYRYCCILAGMATKKPTDFFEGLPVCEAIGLKNMVNSEDFLS